MKITKSQLKQIIEQELNKDLSEGFMDFFKSKKTKAAEAAAAAEIEKINAVIEKLPAGHLSRGNLYYIIKKINDANMPKEIGRLHRALNALEKEDYKQASQLIKNLTNNVPKVKDLLPNIRFLDSVVRADDDAMVIAPKRKLLHPDESRPTPDGDSGAFARSFAKGVGKGARGAFRTKVGFSALEENNMKITKSQLKQIIKEEISSSKLLNEVERPAGGGLGGPGGNPRHPTPEEQQQAMMVRGAMGAGQDQISVDEISISSDGSFKATLSSAALAEPLRVAGKLDFNSTALLQQANAIEAPTELTGPAKEIMEIVDRIKDVYENNERGMPPSLEQLEKLVRSSDFAGIKSNITHIWNDLLKWHQKDGSRLQHSVTTSFNTINTLARKQTG